MELGKYNTLEVARDTESGLFLTDEEGNDVLLPGKFIPPGTKTGDTLEVFIYRDSENRLIATTQTPKILLNEFALLEVTEVGKHGAFLNYGIDKDLFVPFKEQKVKMEVGRWYLVRMFIDEQSNRLAGSAKLEKFLDNDNITVKEGEEVQVIVWNRSDLGINVIVNNLHKGLIYTNELFEDLRIGEVRTAYVHRVREDGKLDIRLQKEGISAIEPNSQKLFDTLKENNGFLPISDNTSPEVIKEILGMSKKSFKKALGALYKQKVVTIEEKGIRLQE